MSDCNHDCSNCASKGNCEIEKAQLNSLSSIKHIIGVISGKGGVGKSFVTSSLASSMAKKGYSVGILDADITGPSIPKAFGITQKAMGEDGLIFPQESKLGIKIISANMLLEKDEDPIVWRGPLLGNLVKQFYEQVAWGELDYLFIDMPPGTGDVALTIFQMIPVEEIIIVTSPQSLVSMIVSKAINMASLMNIKILGVVENMSYVSCPECNHKIEVFGESHLDELAKKENFEILGKIPLIPANLKKVDQGEVERINLQEIDNIIEIILKKEGK